MIDLSQRQIKILGIIVEQYIKTAQPISSKEIIEKYMSDMSSATIRLEMAKLEKMKLIEKTHTSSGRIPSIAGYKYYDQHILKPHSSNDIQNKLKKIFSQRDLNIDVVIDQATSIISESLKLPSVITTSYKDELLKRFDLIQIDTKNAIVIIVTSSGHINRTNLKFDNIKQISDTSTCIRIFNDRLIDTPIKSVHEKLDSIKDIIRSTVHEYENYVQKLIEKIFNINMVNISKQNVVGSHWLTTQPEFKNVEKLQKVLSLLENVSVWQNIAYSQQKDGKTLITFGSDIGNSDLSIASTIINTPSSKHQLSIVGPTRMDYAEVKWLLEFIKKQVEEFNKK